MPPPCCREAWLRIFVVRCSLPSDPPVGGHSCNGGMIPRFHRGSYQGREASRVNASNERLGSDSVIRRCRLDVRFAQKRTRLGDFMSTRPSLTPLADLGRSPWQAPLHGLHAPALLRLVTMPRSARACPSACGSTCARTAASSTSVARLGPWASVSFRKRCARWRR